MSRYEKYRFPAPPVKYPKPADDAACGTCSKYNNTRHVCTLKKKAIQPYFRCEYWSKKPSLHTNNAAHREGAD